MPENGTGNNNNHRKLQPGNSQGKPAEPGGISRPAITGTRVISYNLSEQERPDGIKVRFKIRVVTGKRGKEIDARQAEAIMEVLRWARQHPATHTD